MVDAVCFSLQEPGYLEFIDTSTILELTPEQKRKLAETIVPMLCELLTRIERQHRFSVLLLLRALGQAAREAIPTVLGILDDKDPHFVKFGLCVLLEIAPEMDIVVQAVLRLFRKNKHPFLISTLARLGAKAAPAIPELRALLKNKRRHVRREAAASLIAIGPSGLAALISAQKSPCAATRENAVDCLNNLERGEFDLEVQYIRFPELQTDLVDLAWMDANSCALKRKVMKIWLTESFDNLPDLADVLEEAGCTNKAILNHCRLAMSHSADCWVLKALLDAIRLTVKQNQLNQNIRIRNTPKRLERNCVNNTGIPRLQHPTALGHFAKRA